MASPEDRMSTTVVQADWLDPDNRNRDLDEDYEAGPVALNDTSGGMHYQPWHLTWDFTTGDFTATPETTGAPVVVLNVAAVIQCSFAFDQNAHINIAYTINGGQAYLYWYDTLLADWTTTTLPSYVLSPTLTMDDKRPTQTSVNDLTMYWTQDAGDGTYTLYRALQRERFNPLVPKLMATGVYQYIYKLGMHKGLRNQIGLSDTIF